MRTSPLRRSGVDYTVLHANTPHLPLPRSSPEDATTEWTVTAPADEAYYSLIDHVRMKGWVGLVGWPTGPVVCDAWLSLDYTVSNASVANLLLISFDRYMCVTRPLKYRVRRTPRCAIAMIVVAWVVSTLLWTPWIVAWPFIDVSSIIIIIIITFTHVDYVGRRG